MTSKEIKMGMDTNMDMGTNMDMTMIHPILVQRLTLLYKGAYTACICVSLDALPVVFRYEIEYLAHRLSCRGRASRVRGTMQAAPALEGM